MRLVLVSLFIAVATSSVAHAAPPEPTGTATHTGLLQFLTKSRSAKQLEPTTVLPGTGSAVPAAQAEPVAATPQQAKPVVESKPPKTVKKAAKAKSAKTAKRKSKKLAKKRRSKPVDPDIARSEPEPEQSGRASLVSEPAIEEQPAMAPAVAETEIGPDEGTALEQMIAYKARLTQGDLDGALAALSHAVNTDPNLAMVARLNEIIGVSLDAVRAGAMVDKVAAASQTEPAPPSAPAEARIQAAHGLAAHVGGQSLVNSLADYKKAALANDIPAATFALTAFLGRPIDSASVAQTNALVGLPADSSAARALALTAP